MPRAQMDKSAVAAVVPTPSRATLGSARFRQPLNPLSWVYLNRALKSRARPAS